MAFKLCTLAQIKTRTKSTLGTSLDALLEDQIIPSVTLELARAAGRPDWDKVARTRFFSPDLGSEKIFLDSPPVATSPAVQVWVNTDLPRVYGADELLTEGEDYWVDIDNGILLRNGLWKAGIRTVKTTYTGGYLTADATGAPQDLIEAAILQVKIRFERRESFGLQSESFQGQSFSYSAGQKLDPAVLEMIRNYKVYPGPGMTS